MALQNLTVILDANIAKFKSAMGEVDNTLSNVGKGFDDMKSKIGNINGDSLKKVGGNLQDVGKKLSLVSLPIMAIGTASAKMAIDFEAQMSRVGAIAGATGSEMDALKQSALSLGADTSKSAGEVSVAMEEMASMGFNAIEIMGAMPGVISASEASGESLALASQTVAAALNIWGLEATEASRVADVLAMAANASAAGIGDMQLAFKYAGAPAAALGIEMEDVAAAIGIMTDAGLDGSNAGTSLRASLLALNNPAKAQAKMMEQLGISMRDSEGNALSLSEMVGELAKETEHMTEADKVATLAKLVGTEAVSGFLSLIKAGPAEIDKMSESLRNSAGASAETAALMKDNLKGAFEELGGAMETAAITIGNILTPMIHDGVQVVQSLVEKFTELSPTTQKVMIGLAGFAAAMGPVLLVGGTLLTSIGSIMTGFTAVSGAIAAAGGAAGVFGGALAILTGPIGLTVAGIAALTVGTIALVKHFKKDAIPEVDRFGKGVSDATKEALGGFFELSDGASQTLSELSITSSRVTEDMKNDLVGKFNQMNDKIIAGLEDSHYKQLESTKAFFSKSSVLTADEEAKIIQEQQNSHDLQVLMLTGKENRIKAILESASAEKRALTQAEKDEINNIQQSMNENAVVALSANEMEQKVILERMKNTASELSAQQAAEVVKNSAEQRDKVVAEAEGQYNDTIAEIIRMRDETGAISEEQAAKMIKEAEWARDLTVKQAKGMHEDVVREAQKQAEGHIKQVDWETGEIKSKWQVFKNDVSSTMSNLGANIKNSWNDSLNSTKESYNNMKVVSSATFDAIRSTVSSRIQLARDSVKTATDVMRTHFTSGVTSLYSTGKQKFDELRLAIVNPIESAKVTVKNAVDSILGFFTNLRIPEIKIPHIKLPHFSISGSFSLNPPSIPSIGVNWYRSGSIFKGSREGQIVGLAEGGHDEAVLPLSDKSRMRPFAQAVASMMPKEKGNSSSNEPAFQVVFNIEKMVANEMTSKQLATTVISEVARSYRTSTGGVF